MKSGVTFLLSDPGWCVHKSDVQNKWDDNIHTNTHMPWLNRKIKFNVIRSNIFFKFEKKLKIYGFHHNFVLEKFCSSCLEQYTVVEFKNSIINHNMPCEISQLDAIAVFEKYFLNLQLQYPYSSLFH